MEEDHMRIGPPLGGAGNVQFPTPPPSNNKWLNMLYVNLQNYFDHRKAFPLDEFQKHLDLLLKDEWLSPSQREEIQNLVNERQVNDKIHKLKEGFNMGVYTDLLNFLHDCLDIVKK